MKIKKKACLVGFVALVITLMAFVGCGDDDSSLGSQVTNGEEAWDVLLEGNARFVDGDMIGKDFKERRAELVDGQNPFAVVITCSDSRVVPEYIFDQGLGDIFVIRNAGNVVEPVSLGSIEYGVEHLHAPLLIVLGHTSCGAVTAATQGPAEGNIGDIIDKITPAVEEVQSHDYDDLVDASVDENISLVISNIQEQSPIVKHLVDEGDLLIIGAKYHIDSGVVTISD